MNNFNIFNTKSNEKLTQEEQNKRDKMKLLLYVGFVLIIILFARLSNNNVSSSKQKNNDDTKVDEVIEFLSPLKNNNYEVNINLTIDGDMVNIIKRMQNINTEIFYIKYRGEENAYFRNRDNYYILNNDTIVKTNEYNKLFNYDETFFNPINLVMLLENSNTTHLDIKEEKYNIRRYKIDLNDVLTTYNKINNTNEFTSLSKEISIDVRYNTELEGLYMDFTHFNNYILDSSYSKVIFDMTFSDIGKVNLDTLITESDM